MRYQPPQVPAGIPEDPARQAAYVLEDGFVEVPKRALETRISKDGTLRVKFGVDPTAPAVTFGWSVPLRRLRRFQELGHTAVLVIGDFTAQVGDPSGRSASRRRLTAAEVESYVETCMHALLNILSGDHLEVRRNSEWLSTMKTADVLDLTSNATVAQILDRDDFKRRFDKHQPISLMEMLYPLLQAVDSVAVRADVELGGVDQLFNFMFARTLQERAHQQLQVCVCAPLLVGTDGERKMSQSYGNYIAVSDEPDEIFGKAMSIPDKAVEQFVNLTLDLRPTEKAELISSLGSMKLKRRLAREMVEMFHGQDAAAAAEESFDRMFVRRETPVDVPEVVLSPNRLTHLLVGLGCTSSVARARRAIIGGGIRIDGEPITDPHAHLEPGSYLVQFGRRRFWKIRVA